MQKLKENKTEEADYITLEFDLLFKKVFGEKEDLKPNDVYKNLNKHIQINMDFKGSHEKPIMKYELIEKETLKKLIDIIEIIRIDIPYYRNKCYNKKVSELDSLTRLLGLFGTKKIELARVLCEGDDNMEDIMSRIEKYNDDEDVIGAYDYEAKMKLIAEIEKEEAVKEGHEEGFNIGHQEGFEQGIEQGIEQGSESKQIEIAKYMLNKNTDISFISEVTGLSIEQVQNMDKKDK